MGTASLILSIIISTVLLRPSICKPNYLIFDNNEDLNPIPEIPFQTEEEPLNEDYFDTDKRSNVVLADTAHMKWAKNVFENGSTCQIQLRQVHDNYAIPRIVNYKKCVNSKDSKIQTCRHHDLECEQHKETMIISVPKVIEVDAGCICKKNKELPTNLRF